MAGTRRTLRGTIRVFALIVCSVAPAVLSSVARADACNPGVAALNSVAVSDQNEKFRLIALLCPVLAEPVQVRRAAQLGLYDGSSPLAIKIGGVTTSSPAASAAPAGSDDAPPSPAAARILSLAPALSAAARANELDPLLLHAVAHVESRHNTQALSPAGARGVMQVMPATAQRFGIANPEQSLFDTETNLRAGAAYLRTLIGRYGHDLRLALAAYNAGEGAVAKYGGNVPPYPETQAYVRDVLAVYRRLNSSFTVSPSGALLARGEQP
jgi:soluble lytic murein transglycosylase-like protein